MLTMLFDCMSTAPPWLVSKFNLVSSVPDNVVSSEQPSDAQHSSQTNSLGAGEETSGDFAEEEIAKQTFHAPSTCLVNVEASLQKDLDLWL